MQDLTPVGLTKDGKKLILVSQSGEEFAVILDSGLRAAIRGGNHRSAQLEMKMESMLRPRDIQARIRAGETPEKVATAAQTTVEAIMPFAQPVLDERAHVAQSAMIASVRRRGSGNSTAAGTLLDNAQVYLQTHGLHEEDVSWDAWRRPDGVWLLVATYCLDGNDTTAQFTHDLRGRYVVAENDAARLLTGELQPEGQVSQGLAPPEMARLRPLSAVPPVEELPLGADTLDLVREPDPVPEAYEEITEPQPGLPLTQEESPTADPVDPEPTAKPKKRRGRASVPSWDEIMFGGGQQE